jgi:hypothetical protein
VAHGMPHGPQPLGITAGDSSLPLFKLLKKSNFFCWMDETQKALDEHKALISKPLVLASPKPSETLLLYVVASTQVISATLVVEWEEPGHVYKVQMPIYYTSNVLFDYETRYNQLQKLLYAIFIMKRKLLHYLDSHLLCVVTSYGLGDIIRNRLAMVGIAMLALELMGLNKSYVP